MKRPLDGAFLLLALLTFAVGFLSSAAAGGHAPPGFCERLGRTSSSRRGWVNAELAGLASGPALP
jgi:hypothetical protein